VCEKEGERKSGREKRRGRKDHLFKISMLLASVTFGETS